MVKVIEISREDVGTGMWFFNCPGCNVRHAFNTIKNGNPCWTFNGDVEKPTFTPSLLCRWEWGETKEKRVCHSFVRNGQIQFLNDCTHSLVGQTVALPNVDM